MSLLIYSGLKSPKGAAIVLLALGAMFGAVGIWGLFTHPGVIAWLLMGVSTLVIGTGWLLWGGISQ